LSYYAATLRTPLIENEQVHLRFLRKAGAAYGAVVAVVFVLAFWLPDALALRQASASLWWQKLVIGPIIALPICLLIGWLAASSRWSAITILIWMLGSAALAWLGGRIAFDGLSFIARLSDPYPPARTMYPFSLPVGGFTGISMVIGAIAGLFIGLVSIYATERAWDRSTEHHRLSRASITVLWLCLPFVVIFGLMADFQLQASVRTAFVGVDQTIKIASNPNVDLEQARLPYFKSVRDQLSPRYSLSWNQSSADLEYTTIDVQFDTGLLLRCPHAYGSVFICTNLSQNVQEWMTQLMTVGHLTCVGCPVQVERDTRRWLNAVTPMLGPLREVKLLQLLGGWFYMRGTFDSGRSVDCRFSGDRPIVVDLCVEAK
jgi:hypothetical protein